MSDDIFKAIEQHDLDRLASLLSGATDPNMVQSREPRWRPLHAAIEELEQGGTIETLILLLRYGADVDAWDTNHAATPLLMALFRSQREATRILLARGASANVVGCEGDSPLRWAVEKDDLETAAMLLRCGAAKTINDARGVSGMTALGRAVSHLNIPMINLLLDAGADPKALDADHRTAHQRLPRREDVDPQVWDLAVAKLDRR
jgi:ankyrin repeat protein